MYGGIIGRETARHLGGGGGLRVERDLAEDQLADVGVGEVVLPLPVTASRPKPAPRASGASRSGARKGLESPSVGPYTAMLLGQMTNLACLLPLCSLRR